MNTLKVIAGNLFFLCNLLDISDHFLSLNCNTKLKMKIIAVNINKQHYFHTILHVHMIFEFHDYCKVQINTL